MPIVSRAQQRWAFWAREHASGSEQKAANEFIDKSPHGEGAFKNLPARVHEGKPVRGGRKPKRRFGSLAKEK